MHISLTKELDSLVREKVASGLYNNASEVIRDALRQMVKREKLRAAVDVGIEQAEKGDFSHKTVEQIAADAEKEKYGSV